MMVKNITGYEEPSGWGGARKIPNPGSDEALKMGCKCAVLDNRHGLGAFDFEDGTFWINASCPIHGTGSEWGKKKEVDSR